MFCFLVADPFCRACILTLDVVQKALHLMRAYASIDDYATRYLTGFIYQLSLSPLDIGHIIRNSGTRLLMEQMRKHTYANEDVIRLTTGAINNILKERSEVSHVIQRGGIDYAFGTIKEQADGNPDAVRYCLGIITKLLDYMDGRRFTQRAIDIGAPILMKALRIYMKSDPEIVAQICPIFHLWAAQSQLNFDVLLECEVPKQMIAIVENHSRFTFETVLAAFGVLATLALHLPPIRIELVQTTVLPIATAMLIKYRRIHLNFTEHLFMFAYSLGFLQRGLKILAAHNI
jgi:hypothetical protein